MRIIAQSTLPTIFGEFKVFAFSADVDGKEHLALTVGLQPGVVYDNVLLRMHSSCVTGDALGSVRCDCRQQLHDALRQVQESGQGAILYMDQEGRGIGLSAKIRAYELQDRGQDTFSANASLGFGEDERDYTAGAKMLELLGIRSVRLITNNPEKIEGLKANGIKVTDRVPSIMKPTDHNENYLRAKRDKRGHLL